jgi:sulfopropanediol 3-dehydrogenase
MTLTSLKRGEAPAPAEAVNLSGSVAALLSDLETGREATAQRLSAQLDRWQGDIAYAHENIARFAQAQRDSIRETEVELRPGLTAGQRLIPVNAAGCYVPGGR